MPKILPRKLLIVEAPPKPHEERRFNIMMEVSDQTFTFQVPEAVAEEILTTVQDKIYEVVIQRGLGIPLRRRPM